MDTAKVSAKISALNFSLDELEAELEPLFSQTLPESVVGLENIQQAKLQVLLPYLTYDLIFSESSHIVSSDHTYVWFVQFT